jgi:predicted metalloprotease with PDZ domain
MFSKIIYLIISIYIISMTNAETVTIKYNLAMPDPSSHYFEVGIELTCLKENNLDLILPVWRPGRYYIFDFASGIQEFEAKDWNNKLLLWHKTNKYTWHIESNDKKRLNKVNVNYKIQKASRNFKSRPL